MRNIISIYPKKVFEASDNSLTLIERPFSDLLNEISLRKRSKSYQNVGLITKMKSFFERKPLGYDFVASHYPASLGNLSEVARRKITADSEVVDSIKHEAYNLYKGIQFNDSALILNSVANTYRCMKDFETVDFETGIEIEINSQFYTLLKKVKKELDRLDIFKSYIELIALENNGILEELSLANFNDKELIIYETLKIRLESFFQSFTYPIKEVMITKKIKECQELLNHIINSPALTSKFIVQNLC
ncbi:MAG: hypothetical protein M0R70_02520 [Nitrospirae bacterium]|nr:hypothetical protein [Nitrospirota bacterium]